MYQYTSHLFDGKAYYHAKDKDNKDSNNILDVIECVSKEWGHPLFRLEADGQDSSVQYKYDRHDGVSNALFLQGKIQNSISFSVSLNGEYWFDENGSIFVKESDSTRLRKVLSVNKGTGMGKISR